MKSPSKITILSKPDSFFIERQMRTRSKKSKDPDAGDLDYVDPDEKKSSKSKAQSNISKVSSQLKKSGFKKGLEEIK